MNNPILTLHAPAAARHYYAAGVWREETLYTLLARHAARRPAAFALRDSRRRLTWAELLTIVDAVAADLNAADLKRGERVGVWLPNRVEAIAVLLACSRQGYVCTPSLHRNYTVAEIVELLTRTRAGALFAQPGYGADAHRADIFAAVSELPNLRRVYTLGDGAANATPFPPPGSSHPLPPIDTNPDKVTYLAFTSGTTGRPKGVMHSDNTLLANARAMVEDWRHDERTMLLSLSPLSHHIAAVAIAEALSAGMELVVNDPPPGTTPLDWILETGASYVMGVPTHAMDILGEMRGRGACLMLGYFDNQQATEDSFNRGGWFLSGDLGRFDADGNLEIVGRKKDLIIRGGHNIHPAKIEDLTMRHPAVARCAAFAVADARLGEKVCLSVIFHEGVRAEADELLRHLHEAGLSRFDMPEYFIAISEYPLTASGKILKRELVAWAKSGHIRPVPVRWTEPEPE